jgi:hypothetical protein
LVQEGYVCYYKCRARYRELTDKLNPTTDDKKHFMSLVQTAFSRRIIDLAHDKTKGGGWAAASLEGLVEEQLVPMDALAPAELPAGPAILALRHLPSELKELISVLSSDTTAVVRCLRNQPRGFGRRRLRETTNDMLCRLIGKDPNTVDLAGQLASYLSQE